MSQPFLHVLLRIYRRLPALARRWVVRAVAPSFTVGAMCLIERADGSVLLVRHLYRHKWGLPGGLLARGESPRAAVLREAWEEVKLRVELVGEPAVVVDAQPQRVDIVFRARPAAGADLGAIGPGSAEIIEARWFPAARLPALQHEVVAALAALERAGRNGSSAAPDGSPALESRRPASSGPHPQR